MGEKRLKIKLVKSLISENPKARKTVRALGLKKINQVVEHKDVPQIRGMLERVKHLIKIVEE